MITRFFSMLADAVRSVRQNFLHTLLSILGIVIGVAALVIILSMIDGMEKYAIDQISSTTSLETIMINTESMEVEDGVRLRKDTVNSLNYSQFMQMLGETDMPGKGMALLSQASRLKAQDTARVGGFLQFISRIPEERLTVLAGKLPDSMMIRNGSNVAVINKSCAKELFPGNSLSEIPGQRVGYDTLDFEIMAIVENQQENEPASLALPISTLPDDYLSENPPRFMVRADDISKVPVVEAKVNAWLVEHLGANHDMKVITNNFRVEQINRGFLLFRIIMGLIVGVSVVVGGIGIMNVMIISVTERIREIGIRKAVGARKKEIMMQFLSESVTISGLGSLIGLVLGILLTLGIVPILRALTKAPFQAAFTLNTLLIVGLLAVMIGVVFGTYPALKASRLDPVEAIRHE